MVSIDNGYSIKLTHNYFIFPTLTPPKLFLSELKLVVLLKFIIYDYQWPPWLLSWTASKNVIYSYLFFLLLSIFVTTLNYLSWEETQDTSSFYSIWKAFSFSSLYPASMTSQKHLSVVVRQQHFRFARTQRNFPTSLTPHSSWLVTMATTEPIPMGTTTSHNTGGNFTTRSEATTIPYNKLRYGMV